MTAGLSTIKHSTSESLKSCNGLLQCGFAAMSDLLSQCHHLPSRSKDGFIALLLPEFDVERAIREAALHESCLPNGVSRNDDVSLLRIGHARAVSIWEREPQVGVADQGGERDSLATIPFPHAHRQTSNTHSANTTGNTTITKSPRSQASNSLPAALACFSWSCTRYRVIRLVSTSRCLLTGCPHDARPRPRLRGFQRRTFLFLCRWPAPP